MSSKFAFQCRTCRYLETSGQAGERAYPAACPNCGAGISFDPKTGEKKYADAENWTVLADLSPEDKAALVKAKGLADNQIGGHKPKRSTADREPTAIDASTTDGLNVAISDGGN